MHAVYAHSGVSSPCLLCSRPFSADLPQHVVDHLTERGADSDVANPTDVATKTANTTTAEASEVSVPGAPAATKVAAAATRAQRRAAWEAQKAAEVLERREQKQERRKVNKPDEEEVGTSFEVAATSYSYYLRHSYY